MLDCSHLPLCRRIPGGLDLFMRSLAVRLANELLRLQLLALTSLGSNTLNACLFFRPIKIVFQTSMDVSIFIIQL